MSAERRREGAREVGERRVIERISDPRIKMNFQWIKKWSLGLTLLCLSAGFYEIYLGVSVGPEKIGPAVFFSVIFCFMAVFFYRLHTGIGIYLENESASNLSSVVDRLHALFLTMGVFSVVFFTAHLFL